MRPKKFIDPVYCNYQMERVDYEKFQKEALETGNMSHYFRECCEEKLERVRLVRVKDRNPIVKGWFTVSVNNVRFPANYNDKNDFWSGMDGKTYKTVDYWINA